MPLRDGQAEVDATGRAADVLRRIQVRVPIKRNFIFPEFALGTADSICKRFVTWPGSLTSSGGAIVEMPPQGTVPGTVDYNQSIDSNICSLTN